MWIFNNNAQDYNSEEWKKDEFNYDSDGELILSTKQKMSQRELERGLTHILIWDMTPEKLLKISRGCRRQMLKVMDLAKKAAAEQVVPVAEELELGAEAFVLTL